MFLGTWGTEVPNQRASLGPNLKLGSGLGAARCLLGRPELGGESGRLATPQATGGVQPPVDIYASAVHHLDVASEGRLSGDAPAELPSDWAKAEGTILHDLISYMLRLSRAHQASRDPDIAELKALCPSTPMTRLNSKCHDSWSASA
eukprot:4282083-Alexandrium_andersonii.AAC.1